MISEMLWGSHFSIILDNRSRLLCTPLNSLADSFEVTILATAKMANPVFSSLATSSCSLPNKLLFFWFRNIYFYIFLCSFYWSIVYLQCFVKVYSKVNQLHIYIYLHFFLKILFPNNFSLILFTMDRTRISQNFKFCFLCD